MKIETIGRQIAISVGEMVITLETFDFSSGPVMYIYAPNGVIAKCRRTGIGKDEVVPYPEHLIILGPEPKSTFAKNLSNAIKRP